MFSRLSGRRRTHDAGTATSRTTRKILDWGEAHVDFRTAVQDFPLDLRGEVPPGFSHSAWELMEHLRIAFWDIVEFTRDARHKSPPWPKGYWPPTPGPAAG